MKKTQETLRRENSRKEAVLHLAFELSDSKRKLAFSDYTKRRLVTIRARNLEHGILISSPIPCLCIKGKVASFR